MDLNKLLYKFLEIRNRIRVKKCLSIYNMTSSLTTRLLVVPTNMSNICSFWILCRLEVISSAPKNSLKCLNPHTPAEKSFKDIKIHVS